MMKIYFKLTLYGAIALAATGVMTVQQSMAQRASNASAVEQIASLGNNEKAVHLYVVRRSLNGLGVPHVGDVAHSGVLLKTNKGNNYLLEFMDDSRAHLSKVNASVTKSNNDHLIIKMDGYTDKGMKRFEWTQQKIGAKLDGTHSVKELQKNMESNMAE